MNPIKIFLVIFWICTNIQTALAENPFSVSPSDYKEWAIITAVVHAYDDTNISNTSDVLAAYVGNECRGVALAQHPPDGTRFFLQIWSNTSGETIQFRFYDASRQTIDLVQETILFTAQGVMGSINAPTVLHLEDPREYGCTDPKAINYDPSADLNDNSCIYPPELDYINDQVIAEDTSLTYTLTAKDLNNDLLTFSVQMTDNTISAKIENNIFIATPPKDWHGTIEILVNVTDGSYTDSQSFLLTVYPTNDPPTISQIADQSIYENTSTKAIPFSVSDLDQDRIQVSIQSSNTELIHHDGIFVSGNDMGWYLKLTPLTNAYGESQITVSVNDGSVTVHESFVLTVRPLTVQPTVSKIPTVIIQENTSSDPIPFTVTDIVYGEENIYLTVTTTVPELIPVDNIQIMNLYGKRYLQITPILDKSGTATIVLTGSNPRYSVNSVFTVIVKSKDEMAIFNRFEKLNAQGTPLADSATDYSIVHDLFTDLFWEIKTTNPDIQDKDRQYTWYNPDNDTNGGHPGITSSGGDTHYFIEWLNIKTLGSRSDWRMPEITELLSLVHITRTNPDILTQFFPHMQSGCYWSNTPHAQFKGDAWMANVSDGTDDYISKATNCYVRAVRGQKLSAELQANHFVDNQDDTITDTTTGFMWGKILPSQLTFDDSATTCQNLTIAGYSDWRMPTRQELRTLVRFDRFNPASDLFDQPSDWFWTNESFGKTESWAIYFYYGKAYARIQSNAYFVRPVRAGIQAKQRCFNVKMPLPGSEWLEDDIMAIQWLSCESVENINIYLSRAGGQPGTFMKLAENHVNTGQFNWTVIGPQTYNAVLKIENANDASVFDTQGVFQIKGQPVPSLAVFPTRIEIPAKGGSARITISNAGEGILEWQINLESDWIVPDSSLSGVENGWFDCVVEENSFEHRSACFSVTASNAHQSPQQVCLFQAGNEFIDQLKKVSAGDLTHTLESAWGCNWVDYNHDGWMDIFIVNRHAQDSLYRNNKNRTFTRVTDHVLVNDIKDSTAATWADYDNDHDIDVYVVHPNDNNALYANDGKGNFVLITDDIVVTDPGISYGASWVDINNDGHVDLFVTQTEFEPNALYINQGNGHFEKNTTSRISSGHGKTLAWGDYRQNGWMDLIIPQKMALYLNTGQLSFFVMESSVLDLDSTQQSFNAAIWADFDNDTCMDLFITDHTKNNVLLHNDCQGSFNQMPDIPPALDGGQSSGASWADFDQDGDLDLFVSRLDMNNLFYVNNGNGQFNRILSGDIANGNGRASAVADYDNDGDLDLLVIQSGNPHLLFENKGFGEHWIGIRCVGVHANTLAIGAQITVNAAIYGKTVQQIRQIVAQKGHNSQDSPIMLFGLGNQSNIDSIQVDWPGGAISRLTQVPSDQYITIVESDSGAKRSLTVSPSHEIVFALEGNLSVKVIVENDTNPLTWTAQTSCDWISFNGPQSGTQTQSLNIHYNHNPGHQRDGQITIQPDDISLSSVTMEIIQNANVPPQWHLPIQDLYLTEDNDTVQISFHIEDPDTEMTDFQFFSHGQNSDLLGSQGVSLMPHPVTPNTMNLLLRPRYNQYGDSIVSVAVVDGIHQYTDTIWVHVSPVNDMPILSPLRDQTIHEDELLFVSFTVTDVDEDNIAIHVESLAPGLIDDNDIWIQKNGHNYSLQVLPVKDQYGMGQLKLTISDGSVDVSDIVDFTILSVNDRPTMSPINDQEILETSVAIPFTVADAETLASQLQIQARSHSPNLIPSDHMLITATDNTYQLILTGPDNLFGIASVELSVSDGSLTQTQVFNVFVRNAGNVPMIANVLDQRIFEDETLSLTLTVGGVASQAIVITGTSSNPALVSDKAIQIDGIGQKRQLNISPNPDASGQTQLTLHVTDGNHTIYDDFILLVVPVNDPPVISKLNDIWFREDTGMKTISFSTSDVDSNHLSVNAVSSDISIIPDNTMDLQINGSRWDLTLKPSPNAFGNCQISVLVSDGLTTTVASFGVDIQEMNDTPIIQTISDQVLDEDTSKTIALFLSDEETPLTALQLSVHTDNPLLIPPENIHFNENLTTMTVSPLTDANGQANITLYVDDGSGLPNSVQSDRFVLLVRPINDKPIISPIDPQTVPENGSTSVQFTVDDAEKTAQELIIEATSDNQTLVPDSNLVITVDDPTQVLEITPRPYFSGETQIHIAVFDGATTVSQSFTLTVSPKNYPPDFLVGMDIYIWEDAPPQKLSKWATQISPGPVNENGQALNFKIIKNSHPQYFKTPPVVTSQGDLHYTLTADANGTAEIHLVLMDDALDNNVSQSQRFFMHISPVNDPPSFTIGPDIIIVEDAANCLYTQWAKFISPGAANESNQKLTFVLETDTTELFEQLPTVSRQGDLEFILSPNANGRAVFDIYLEDNGEVLNTSAIDNFYIEIIPENDPPTMTPVSDETIHEDTPWSIDLTINDVDTPLSQLSLTVCSANTHLFPDDCIHITENGHQRHLEIIPSPNLSGVSALTITLWDGFARYENPFTLTVLPVNDPPIIVPIDHQYVQEDGPLFAIPLTVTDAESAPTNIVLTAVANEPQMFSMLAIEWIENQAFVHFQSLPNVWGTTSIDILASDSINQSQTKIAVTILPEDDPPTIKFTPPFEMVEDHTAWFPVEIDDIDTDNSTLLVNIQSGNPLIVPDDTDFLYIQGDRVMRRLYITPNAHANGEVNLTLTVRDAINVSQKRIQIMIASENDAPIANDFRLKATEDQLRKADFQAIDMDSDSLSYTIIAQGNLGMLTCSEGNTFEYSPFTNAHGKDYIQYQVSDGILSSNIGIITIDIEPVNDMPQTQGLHFHVMEDSMTRGYLTATDPDNDRLTYNITKSPQKGKVFITDDRSGAFYYQPDANACCQDAFTYRVYDGTIDSMAAIVTIDITPVNDLPTVTALELILDEDTTIQGQLSGIDIDNDPLTFETVIHLGMGVFVLKPDGHYTYTPTKHFNGADFVLFKAFDGTAFSNIARIDITVEPVNDMPVASSDQISLNEDQVIQWTLLGEDIDNDALSFQILELPQNGSVTVLSDGDVTYTPDKNFWGTDTFSFIAHDGTASSEAAWISLTVAEVNDRPVVENKQYKGLEDGMVSGQLQGSDEEQQPLTISVTDFPKQGKLTYLENGQFTYTPDRDFAGNDSFYYTASDGFSQADPACISLIIFPVNDSPRSHESTYILDEDTIFSDTFMGEDVDQDQLTYQILQNGQLGLARIIDNQTGSFTYTPDRNQYGVDTLTFRVSDGTVNSIPSQVTLVIQPVNDPPVANNSQLSTSEDMRLIAQLSATDIDGDPLSFKIIEPVSNGQMSISNSATGAFLYYPDENFYGTDQFTFQVIDTQGAESNAGQVDIAVMARNDRPIAWSDSLIINEDQTVTAKLQGTDIDFDTLTFALDEQPSKGKLSMLDATKGTYIYTPFTDISGMDGFTFSVFDGTSHSDPARITIEIVNINDPPETMNAQVNTMEDHAVSGSLPASDPDNDRLIYEIIRMPYKGNVKLSVSDGIYVYTPNTNENGSDTMTFQVNDGRKQSMPSTVTFTIYPVNDAPVVGNLVVSVGVNEAIVHDFPIDDPDYQDHHHAQWVSGPEVGYLEFLNDGFRYRSDQIGIYRFFYRVNDGYLDSNVGQVMLLVGNTEIHPDIDGNGNIELADAILGLRALAGMADDWVNLRDVIFVLNNLLTSQ